MLLPAVTGLVGTETGTGAVSGGVVETVSEGLEVKADAASYDEPNTVEDAKIAVMVVPKAMLRDSDGERVAAVKLIGSTPTIDPVGPATNFASLEIDPVDDKVELEYGPIVE
jgi:hypothetical protein